MHKLISILLFASLLLPIVFANPLEKTFLDMNYLTHEFLMNAGFEKFNKEGAEIILNKEKPLIGDNVRIAITDTNSKKEANIFLLNKKTQKKFTIKEISEGTGVFLLEIKITETLTEPSSAVHNRTQSVSEPEEDQTFPLSNSLIIFYNSLKPYKYYFGEGVERKQQEEKIEEQKQQEVIKEKNEEVKQQNLCEYYRTDEIEAFSDYMFIESTQACEDLIPQYKDQVYNKAKTEAIKECEKIGCVKTNCNCQKSFQEFPYEEEKMECTPVTGRDQTRLSYKIEGACICKC